jgi:leucyl/phenylalanyl-tRNA---protein transferase
MALRDLISIQGLFPDIEHADDEGLLAYGGCLEPEYLIEAYGHGIFPWFSEGDPILWWSPNPRMVLFPAELKISKSLRSRLNRGEFTLSADRAFAEVIRECAAVARGDDKGTWITTEMIEAYERLHVLGIAHSIEAWKDGELAGGLYGIAIGRMFFGESMFHRRTDASKAALAHLCQIMIDHDFALIDAQLHTTHLESLGARLIPRGDYLDILGRNINREGIYNSWSELYSDLKLRI